MAQVKLYHVTNHGKRKILIETFPNKESAVKFAKTWRLNDWPLDKEEFRTEGLELRNFCCLGCGDDELEIVEEN